MDDFVVNQARWQVADILFELTVSKLDGNYMTSRMGTLVSLLAGGFVGIVASFVPMIFGPLVFPEAISGPTLGENIVGISIPAFFFLFGAVGFFVARRLIARFIDHGTDTNRTFT